MSGTWFHDKDKPNEAYIGCGVFAVFDDRSIWLVNKQEGRGVRIAHGGPLILSGALKEWREKHT